MAETLHALLQKTQKLHDEASNERDIPKLRLVLEQYNNLLNLAIEEPHLIFLVATVNLQVGNNGLAINMFKRSLELAPDLPETWNNMGSAYKAEHMDDKAEECFLKALSLKDVTDYHNNLSTIHINKGTPEKGLPYVRHAIAMDEYNVKAHWNLSLILLELGQWEEGFAEYDAGILTHDRMDRHFDNEQSIPYWQGQKLTNNMTFVVYGEQGLGDEIMGASAIPDLIATGVRVIYECHDRLESIMRRSFPGIEIYPTRKSEYIEWPKDRKIDYRCAIGSLFRWFRPQGEFPREIYLKPNPERVKYYREWLETLGPGPYVGIGYGGGHKRTHGHERSLQLTPLKPLLEKDCTFISLQYSPDAKGKFERFYDDTGIEVHHFTAALEAWSRHTGEGETPLKNIGFNYDETLALIAALDLCILPNTTAVHACGAIGQQCWTLTPDACAWRYAQGGPHMVMYGPWVTQYRENGNWDKAIDSMAQHLKLRVPT